MNSETASFSGTNNDLNEHLMKISARPPGRWRVDGHRTAPVIGIARQTSGRLATLCAGVFGSTIVARRNGASRAWCAVPKQQCPSRQPLPFDELEVALVRQREMARNGGQPAAGVRLGLDAARTWRFRLPAARRTSGQVANVHSAECEPHRLTVRKPGDAVTLYVNDEAGRKQPVRVPLVDAGTLDNQLGHEVSNRRARRRCAIN